ncbi:MAG TPA: phosphoribosylformylglycinamidine synthase subunit PurL [bacterium]|nr:phosphoribosylformylglycinamidine synthase subunit PurL [bacterium]
MKNVVVDLALAKEHGLSAEEFARVKEILGRDPSITELGIFSVMWSEHCSYKSSRVHLRRFPTSGPRVLQGPGENAGVVDIGDGWAVAFKMESHNHPSFIEPYQGAATGVGGILRDVFTMGARPILAMDSLRFGAIDHPKTKYLLGGVVGGIAGYGNAFGVPTAGGETVFDAAYNGNILVNAFALGLLRADKIFRAQAAGVGNPVMYVGARTGRDGIHGATMASAEFDEKSEEKRPTVQVGDPFTEKLLMEACMELFQTDCVVAIQDMGAAGLTSSSVEMAGRGGMGIELELDRVPMREEGMTPYEIMLSESQERMLLVAKAGREDEVRKIFQKWDLEVAVIGRLTDTGRIVVKQGGKSFVDMPVLPVSDKAPVYDRPQKAIPPKPPVDPNSVPVPKDLNETYRKMLGDPNLASKKWIYRQYDHMVRTNTLTRPGDGDAAVLRIKGTKKLIAASTDCNGRYCALDPFVGGAGAVAEAARNVSTSGATPLAITDCLNFGNPERPEIMWQFARAVDGIAEACHELETPVVSGNVSLYNETDGVAIHPTPTVGMVGLLEDPAPDSRLGAMAFESEGDAIFLVGKGEPQLGGSEYLAFVHGRMEGPAPRVDFEMEKKAGACVREAMKSGLARSAHDLSDGGFAVALAECALVHDPKPIGAKVKIDAGARGDVALFGESHGRYIVSTRAADAAKLEALATKTGAPISRIGTVGGDRIVIEGLVDVSVTELHAAWTKFPAW